MTIKQKKFVENILAGDNQTQAAIKAGYKPKNARIRASENVSKSNIKAHLDQRIAEIEANTEITIAYIQAEHERLKRLAESKNKLDVATTNVQSLGKTIAAYADKSIDTVDYNDKTSADNELESLKARIKRLEELEKMPDGIEGRPEIKIA